MAINGAGIRSVGRLLRRVGQSLDGIGRVLQDKDGYVERLVPSTRVVPIKGKTFTYGFQNFVASTASVVGEVQLGEQSSVWYGATLRGDRSRVSIGRNSSVLDNAIVSGTKTSPARIGDDVVVQTGAVVEGAEVGNGSMIGMGAKVRAGAVVGADSFVDAGAVVPAGTKIPAGQLWTGAPARFLRNLTTEEMSYLRSSATVYSGLAEKHQAQGEKTVAQTEEDHYWYMYKLEHGMKPEDPIPQMDADVIEFYKLTAPGPDSGLFRGHEYDVGAEGALREAEEVAADAAEEEMYAQAARMRRVGSALRTLSTCKPAARAAVVADLDKIDPAGASLLRDLVSRIGDAAASNDAAAKTALLNTIRRFDEGAAYYANDKEATDAAQAIFDGVVAARDVVAPARAGGAASASASPQ